MIFAHLPVKNIETMEQQERMIKEQLEGRDINDRKVLQAMRSVDRKLFVPEEIKHMAYDDTPLPIGKNQTISQPYIVAYMAQALNLQPHEKILEIGSGCGYNAAVLSQLVSHVYSVEIIGWLADMAQNNLKKANIENVSVRSGDGYQGWPEHAPFDKALFTAATPQIPEPVKKQLKTGGIILAPITDTFQKLSLFEKLGEDDFIAHDLLHVRFVPMTGKIRR